MKKITNSMIHMKTRFKGSKLVGKDSPQDPQTFFLSMLKFLVYLNIDLMYLAIFNSNIDKL